MSRHIHPSPSSPSRIPPSIARRPQRAGFAQLRSACPVFGPLPPRVLAVERIGSPFALRPPPGIRKRRDAQSFFLLVPGPPVRCGPRAARSAVAGVRTSSVRSVRPDQATTDPPPAPPTRARARSPSPLLSGRHLSHPRRNPHPARKLRGRRDKKGTVASLPRPIGRQLVIPPDRR